MAVARGRNRVPSSGALGIADQACCAKANLFRHSQRLAFVVEFINMVFLGGFDGGAEENQTVLVEKARDRPEKGPGVLKMLCQHRRNDSLILAAFVVPFKGDNVFHCKVD